MTTGVEKGTPLKAWNRKAPVQRVRLAGYRGWVLKEYLDLGWRPVLKNFLENGMRTGNAVKTSRHSAVHLLEFKETALFVKRYPQDGLKAMLRGLFRRNRAQKAWYVGRRMRARGLATPLPVFYVFRKVSLLASVHVVGTREIAGGLSLKDFVREHFTPGNAAAACKRRFIEHLAAFIAGVHRGGIYHGDLTANNIFVSPPDKGGGFHFQLIDLDAIRSTRWISPRRRIKNLDELGRNFLDLRVVDFLDRARFLRRYVEVYAGSKTGFRPLLEAVKRRTAYRLRKHEQRFYRSEAESD